MDGRNVSTVTSSLPSQAPRRLVITRFLILNLLPVFVMSVYFIAIYADLDNLPHRKNNDQIEYQSPLPEERLLSDPWRDSVVTNIYSLRHITHIFNDTIYSQQIESSGWGGSPSLVRDYVFTHPFHLHLTVATEAKINHTGSGSVERKVNRSYLLR